MSESDETVALSAADYAVFGVMLGVSAAVGVFFAYRDRKQKELDNYLLGDRSISPWASGISASLSFLSGATVLGAPAEIVYFGATYTWYLLGILIAAFIANEGFLPVYHRLGLSSANEYYGLRFGKVTRYIATVIYIIQTVTYMGVMIYAPALALNAVSSFSLWGAILSVGIVCTIYTTLGGLKAVIWTDVIQGVILFIVLLVIFFKSAGEAGGFDEVFRIASEGDRLDFFHFEMDPRYRMTVWATVFGLGSMFTSIACTNQAVVQRFLCCKTVFDGKVAMYVSAVFGGLIFLILIILGFIAYAYFADCDPVQSGELSAGDQILPYMTLKTFQDLPGLSGLFIAGIFAAALSTVSSALNGMSAVTVNDLIIPNVKWSEKTLLWVSKTLTLVYGALSIAFAYFSSLLGGLIQAALSLLGMCAGPLLGPIVLGTLLTFTNEKGAVSGMLIAFGVNIWLYIGATIYPAPKEFSRPKNISIEGCFTPNVTINETFSTTEMLTTTVLSSTTTETVDYRPPIAEFYAVSFTYYALIGIIVCIIVGSIVSCATGGWKSRHTVDARLISLPFEHRLLRWLPSGFRRFMAPKMRETKDIEDYLTYQNYGVSDLYDEKQNEKEKEEETAISKNNLNIFFINDKDMISHL